MTYRCFVCDSNDPCILSTKSFTFVPVFCPYDEDAPIWDKAEKIAKNTEQQVQPDNGGKCTRPENRGCPSRERGRCVDETPCPPLQVN